MSYRSFPKIRRDINRLVELIARMSNKHPPLAALATPVRSAADTVNRTWNAYQEAAATADKERTERDDAVAKVYRWIQCWRPVVMLSVPGASTNVHNLPASGATPDDMLRTAEDMRLFIDKNPGAESFRKAALDDLGNAVTSARKELQEATDALPRELGARSAYNDACTHANHVLVTSLNVVRALFGATAPEYRQFIGRSSVAEETEEETEATVGESA